jgi:site-specific DNA-methyltransferase (adenine-specific)
MKQIKEENYTLILGDNLQSMKTMEDNSIDSVVTDPPYGLTSIVKRFGKANSKDAQFGTDGVFKRSSKGFMGKEWDSDVPSVEFWREVYRILKPGGHILSFGGTRTYHRLVTAIEDSGFEIRDQLQWIYGQGFPKSHNIGKKLKDWEGWGTALKPANEPICLARKPISEKTIAENVLKWGTGGLNIDGCRIETDDFIGRKGNPNDLGVGILAQFDGRKSLPKRRAINSEGNKLGRFPSNVIFDQDASELLNEQSGITSSKADLNYQWNNTNTKSNTFGNRGNYIPRNDTGGASRFFYCPKVSKKERDMGLEDFDEKLSIQKGHGLDRICGNCGAKMLNPQDCICKEPNWILPPKKNSHPTVKPINLMTYLVKLITPIGGTVLDPFMGSGSGGIGTLLEGFNFIGMEQDSEYFEIATARIKEYESYREILTKPKKTKRKKVIVEKDLEIGEPVMTFWLNQAV